MAPESPLPPPLPPAEEPGWPPMGPAYLPPVPARPVRPGLVVVVGVLSLIVAAVSLIGHILVAAGAGLAYLEPVTVPARPTTPTPVAPATAPKAIIDKDALPADERNLVVLVYSRHLPLTPQRREHLDAMLAKAGRRVLATGDAPMTEDLAAGTILDFGRMPSADPARQGPDFFRTTGGRLEISDDGAAFYPRNNVYAVIRASAEPSSYALSPQQIQTVVQQAQAAGNNALNPSQVATLGVVLSSPTQTLVPTVAAGQVVRSVAVQPDGTAVVSLPGGSVGLGAQGQVVTPGAAPGAPPTRRIGPSGGAVALVVIASVAAAGLAVYLLVSAILLLRGSPRGRRLHLIYAVAQVVLSVAVVIGVVWLTRTVRASADAAGVALPPGTLGFRTLAVLLDVVALVYAAVLLAVMNTRTMREFGRPALGGE